MMAIIPGTPNNQKQLVVPIWQLNPSLIGSGCLGKHPFLCGCFGGPSGLDLKGHYGP